MLVILRLRETSKSEIQEIKLPPEEAKDLFWHEYANQHPRHGGIGLGPRKFDWQEWTNDLSPEAKIRVPANQFDFKARLDSPRPVSASTPTPKIPARREEDKFNIPLKCSISGIHLGKFVPSVGLAVATPYVTAWKQTAFLHPVFSLKLSELLHRAEACWNLEKTGTRTFPMQHKQLLFLAMMHASGCIRQEVAALPSPKITETHFMRVVELLGWKYETASERVQFPKLHVWKGAAKEDEWDLFRGVSAWLDACEAAKEEYESVARTRMAAAKARARELALKSIRKQAYADVSLRRLWNWIDAQVPQTILENNPDLEMLFFTQENQIHKWQQEDIEALEDLLLTHCETGNSISYEVGKRIRQLSEWRSTYADTFEIVQELQFTEFAGTPEPRPEAYASRAAYLVAHAKWKLGNKPTSNNTEEL